MPSLLAGLEGVTGAMANYVRAKRAGNAQEAQRHRQAAMDAMAAYKALGQAQESKQRMELLRTQSEQAQRLMPLEAELLREQIGGARVTRKTGELSLAEATKAAELRDEIDAYVRKTHGMPEGAIVTDAMILETLQKREQITKERELELPKKMAEKTVAQTEADIKTAQAVEAQAAEDITRLTERETEEVVKEEVLRDLEKARAEQAVAEGTQELEQARKDTRYYERLPGLELDVLDRQSQAALARARASEQAARVSGKEADILAAKIEEKKGYDEILRKMGFDPMVAVVEKALIEGDITMSRQQILAAIGTLERAAAMIQSRATAAEVIEAMDADPAGRTEEKNIVKGWFQPLPGAMLSAADKDNAIKRLELLIDVYIEHAEKWYPDMDLRSLKLRAQPLSQDEIDRLAEEARKRRGTQ